MERKFNPFCSNDCHLLSSQQMPGHFMLISFTNIYLAQTGGSALSIAAFYFPMFGVYWVLQLECVLGPSGCCCRSTMRRTQAPEVRSLTIVLWLMSFKLGFASGTLSSQWVHSGLFYMFLRRTPRRTSGLLVRRPQRDSDGTSAQ